MNVLYYALDANKFNHILDTNEFNHILIYNSAKEVWNRLEITHEGINQVKESKINILVHRYELFNMKSDESITQIFTCFTDIINDLKSLDKSYSNSDLIRKVFMSLPKKWEAKVIAIQEVKDLNVLLLEGLFESLMIYELQWGNIIMKRPRKKIITLKPIV